MREIKFRAWYEGKMYEVYTYNISDKSVYISLPRFPFSQRVYSDNVMQYTGLKDKNGKEIYEGDLLSHKFYSAYVQVTFKDGAFIAEDVSMFSDSIEIIGNIYENPDLLDSHQ